MAKRLQEILEGAGLSQREARVYLTMLQYPESNLADIARATLIPRMSCYALLGALTHKGFVDVLVKKRRRYFVTVPPHRIGERFSRHAEEFKESLSRFERYSKTGTIAPRVRFFEGADGIRAVFRNILDEKRSFMAIACIEDMERIASTYFEEFIRRRIQQHLRVRLLTNHTPASLRLKRTDSQELRETRFVPEPYRFNNAEYIFGNNIAILSLKHDLPTALLIEDEEIAKTHKMYFELLWTMANAQ